MKVIGLTGGSGSGKSKVAAYLQGRYNAFIIDADVIGHQVISKGKIAYDKIISCFGNGILQKNQQIDRKKLGEIVFADYEKLKILNNITHPLIKEEIKERINTVELDSNKYLLTVIDGALLIDVGIHQLVDELWIVYADRDVRFNRLKKRDDLSEEMIRKRIESQMSWLEMKKYGDRIINNSSSFEETMLQCDRVLKELFHS